jgi:hypothetical protein
MGGGFALAVSPLFWSQAIVTEVHALNGLFFALVLNLVSLHTSGTWRTRRQSAGLAVVVGLVWGLSLGNHPTALFALPLAVLVLWRLDGIGWGAIGVLLGLAVFLYVPFRAVSTPSVNWGDARTLTRFGWLVSGALYRPFLFSLPPAFLPARLLAWANVVARQFGWLGLTLCALGAVTFWNHDRAFFGATAAVIVLCSVFAIGYNVTDSHLYLVPAVVCLGLWLGMGLDWLLDVTTEATVHIPWAVTIVSGLMVALPLAAALCRLPAQSLRDDRSVHVFEAEVLNKAPAEALILSQEDIHTFTLWYLQHALGQRADVTTVDLDLLQQDWYAAHLSPPLAGSIDLLLTRERDLKRVAERLNRPVCTIRWRPTLTLEYSLACSKP